MWQRREKFQLHVLRWLVSGVEELLSRLKKFEKLLEEKLRGYVTLEKSSIAFP